MGELKPHDDVLIVVAEAASENVDAARMLGILANTDAQPDRVVRLEPEIFDPDVRKPLVVEKGPGVIHPPAGEPAVLRPLELPPGGRVDAALVPEVAGRGPAADEHVVDPDTDVRWPVDVGSRHLRGQLHAELELLDLALENAGIVGKLVLDVTTAEPDQRRRHASRVEEQGGGVEAVES